MKTILNGIIRYYENTYNIRFDDKYNRENPYEVTEWLWDFQDVFDDKGDWETYKEVKVENNLDEIFKLLGYEDIYVVRKEMKRLDFSHDQELQYIFSYKHQDTYADDELAFVGYLGDSETIEIIQFIVKTIAAYKSIFPSRKEFDKG